MGGGGEGRRWEGVGEEMGGGGEGEEVEISVLCSVCKFWIMGCWCHKWLAP